jgi:hypothetical protein
MDRAEHRAIGSDVKLRVPEAWCHAKEKKTSLPHSPGSINPFSRRPTLVKAQRAWSPKTFYPRIAFPVSGQTYRVATGMNGVGNTEKADFEEQLRKLMNQSLAAEESKRQVKFCVKDLDLGIVLNLDDPLGDLPDGTGFEDVAAPVYQEDLIANASLMLDLHVIEQHHGLWSTILLRVQIDEQADVVVKKQEIDETEILMSDLHSQSKRAACKEQLDAMTDAIASAAKTAILHLMREENE